MADVIVIGGGIVGASAAWQLAELGARVTLLERGALASGATARSQGLLLPPDHAELHPVFNETLRLYRRLAAESGIDFELDDDEVLREEPALAPHLVGGLLYPDGFRTDPGALTAAAASAARAAGAAIH